MFEPVEEGFDVRKLTLTAGGAATAAAATLALGLGLGLGVGSVQASPGDTNTTLNVVGEPYARAVAILRAQGVKASFGGAVGSDVPQAQCIVSSQKVLTASHKMQLNLDCTAEAQPQSPASTTAPGTSGQSTSGAPAAETARPTPGAPGVVTVAPKPVG